jgi:phage host-nuclease inhibitor protein Gam
MGRPKKAAVELENLAECDQALADLRAVNSDIQGLDSEKSRAVAAASALFEAALDERKKTRGELLAALGAYYYAHRAEIEKDGAKHVQMANGRMGRRDCPEALKPLNRKWGWEAICNAVRAEFGPTRFFRAAEPQLDEEALKAARLAVEELKQLGLKLEADEKFYAEPAALPAATEVTQ